MISSYAYGGEQREFAIGEGFVGQAAVEKRPVRIEGVPAGYLTVEGGLGRAPAADVIVLPVLFEEHVLGVIELAAFLPYSEQHLIFLDRLVETIGVVLNTIIANSRTEGLLSQSQRLTKELRNQSDELQRANAELQEKAQLLTAQSRDLETKNREVELAGLGLEEKALQLESASNYKSEFLANMSHELRTPLNSLLILANLLADNPGHNLTDEQIEFARMIHRAGSDLLELIEDILDLSKVEAGKMEVRPAAMDIRSLCEGIRRSFEPVAGEKNLGFVVQVDPAVPDALVTDEQRLRQILKNLLSNAFKFTDSGCVTLEVFPSSPTEMQSALDADKHEGDMVAFSVSDTGIGVPGEKLRQIFEAFQQSDGTTSRKYGGTGLGLSISRQIARLLGGSIGVESNLGAGSAFTVYVPAQVPSREEAAQKQGAPPTESERFGRGPILAASKRPSDLSAQRPSLAGSTILVIDDDVRNVFALTSALEFHGSNVLYAGNGTDGLRTVQEHPDIDLVLMDVMMPDMDGNQTTAAIRSTPGREQLPVLFLTAKAMAGDREKSFAAGASDYLTKPVDLDGLLASMPRLLPLGTPGSAAAPGSTQGPAEAGAG
jgi:signal transduction histidine kinase/ActR/RegA family two-component response regulator